MKLQATFYVISHIILQITLQVAERMVKLRAIDDSGAYSCFLDINLGRDLHIPLRLKKQRLDIHLADSTSPSTGPVTQETIPILTTTDTGHRELLRFDIIRSLIFPAILGIPWLQAHNPLIDWSKGEFVFSSSYCH